MSKSKHKKKSNVQKELPPSGAAASMPPPEALAKPAEPPAPEPVAEASPPPPSAAVEPSPPAPAPAAPPATPHRRPGALTLGFQVWFSAYRPEVIQFAACALVLASFSSQRFLRQSAAPHFIYQAKAWLEGRLDLDPQVLPNLEDCACVRNVGG